MLSCVVGCIVVRLCMCVTGMSGCLRGLCGVRYVRAVCVVVTCDVRVRVAWCVLCI